MALVIASRWTSRLVEIQLAEAVALGHPVLNPEDPAKVETASHQSLLRCVERLDPFKRTVVLARASGARWKDIAERHGIDRTTAWRRWSIAIASITARLNAEADAATLQHRSERQATSGQIDSLR